MDELPDADERLPFTAETLRFLANVSKFISFLSAILFAVALFVTIAQVMDGRFLNALLTAVGGFAAVILLLAGGALIRLCLVLERRSRPRTRRASTRLAGNP